MTILALFRGHLCGYVIGSFRNNSISKIKSHRFYKKRYKRMIVLSEKILKNHLKSVRSVRYWARWIFSELHQDFVEIFPEMRQKRWCLRIYQHLFSKIFWKVSDQRRYSRNITKTLNLYPQNHRLKIFVCK